MTSGNPLLDRVAALEGRMRAQEKQTRVLLQIAQGLTESIKLMRPDLPWPPAPPPPPSWPSWPRKLKGKPQPVWEQPPAIDPDFDDPVPDKPVEELFGELHDPPKGPHKEGMFDDETLREYRRRTGNAYPPNWGPDAGKDLR